MESKWSDIGFLGSILLVGYGLLALLIYYTPPSTYGAFSTIIASGMAVLSIIAGVCFSFGFLAVRMELNAPSSWLTYSIVFLTWVTWAFYGVSQILVALGLTIGLVYWFFSIYGIMVVSLFWGMFFFSVRKQLGGKERFAFGAAMLFFINGLGWVTFIGFGILALSAFLCLLIFAPATKYSIFSPIIRFLSPKRVGIIRLWAPIFLIIYSLLAMKWVINGIFPLPVVIAAVVNILSLLLVLVLIIGITMVLRSYERRYEISTLWYAQLAWIPSMLLVMLADLQWLMSNITVFIDPAWGLVLYDTLVSFLGWCSVSLTIFSFIAAISFMQLYRLHELRGETILFFLHLSFLASGFIWLTIAMSISGLLPIIPWVITLIGLYLLDIFSIGFLGFFFVGIFLWRHWRKITRAREE
ncbi:MAG: hypothetical protein ACFFCH_07015 [Promethearchaeota archaeon]